jgi:hypothetical protein
VLVTQRVFNDSCNLPASPGITRILHLNPDRHWTAETYRPTRDLDFLGRGVFNVSYRKIFSEMCSHRVEDDGLTFLPDTIWCGKNPGGGSL